MQQKQIKETILSLSIDPTIFINLSICVWLYFSKILLYFSKFYDFERLTDLMQNYEFIVGSLLK